MQFHKQEANRHLNERCMLSTINSMKVVGNIYMIVLSPSHTFSAIISLNLMN